MWTVRTLPSLTGVRRGGWAGQLDSYSGGGVVGADEHGTPRDLAHPHQRRPDHAMFSRGATGDMEAMRDQPEQPATGELAAPEDC